MNRMKPREGKSLFHSHPRPKTFCLTSIGLFIFPSHSHSKGSENSPSHGYIRRGLDPLHASSSALRCSQSEGLERFPVFKKPKSKSVVIFFKYILLNKTSILDASSKLRNMFKMTWLITRRLFQDVSNFIFLVKECELSNMMYGLIRRCAWTEIIYLCFHFWQMNINYWENCKAN